jgi:2-C-methyl-D-erythritol 2,4-cyclodiphosphate synthase
LLSAANLGDLGSNFGTDKPEYKNASGVKIISSAAKIVKDAGWKIENVAVQLIGNKPKIGSKRVEAEKILSEAIGAPVSLGATTTDGLGLTGRGEGLAAIAQALISK